jgi:hypothetical protein
MNWFHLLQNGYQRQIIVCSLLQDHRKKIPAGANTWNEFLLKKYNILEAEGLPLKTNL